MMTHTRNEETTRAEHIVDLLILVIYRHKESKRIVHLLHDIDFIYQLIIYGPILVISQS